MALADSLGENAGWLKIMVMGFVYPVVLAWSFSGCYSVLMFCLRMLWCSFHPDRRVEPCLLSVFSPLAARTVTIYGYQTCYQPRSAKSSCFSRRRSAPCRGNRVIVRLLHSGFVRLCWLWGIGERLCPEVLDRDLGLMWNWNAA